LKPDGGGSLLVQEKYREEMPVTETSIMTIIIIIVIQLMLFCKKQLFKMAGFNVLP